MLILHTARSILGSQGLSNEITTKPVSPNTLANMQMSSTSYWRIKSIVNGETYQILRKWSNKLLFGSIIGKNVFYKTIAHKNTTSLKNNHNCLTAHMCKLVKSLNSKLGNQPVKISEIIITISMITLIKVIKETEYVLQDSSQSSQSAVGEKKKKNIHSFVLSRKKKLGLRNLKPCMCLLSFLWDMNLFFLIQVKMHKHGSLLWNCYSSA